MRNFLFALRGLLQVMWLTCIAAHVGCSSSRAQPPSAHESLTLFQSEYRPLSNPACTSFLTRLINDARPPESPPVSLLLIDAPHALALSPSPGVVAVSGRLLERLPHEGETFFMLAHEVGHTALNHHEHSALEGLSMWSSPRRELELEADTFALKRLTAAGYPAAYAVSALRRAYQSNTEPDGGSSDEYPSLHERIEALMLQLPDTSSPSLRGVLEHREYHTCRSSLRSTSARAAPPPKPH